MKNKKLAIAIVALCYAPLAFAGGILTNTNQSARFARYMALEASTNIDAAYYNPAGLAKLNEGFHFSFSNQSAFQKRKISSTFPLYKQSLDGIDTKKYEGTASAPIIPSLQAAYKKGKWTLSGSLAVVGGGGKATFNNGLSLFESQISQVPQLIGLFTSTGPTQLGATRYSIDQYMTGSNFIYGGQIGGTYEINKMFSAYAGFRLNVVNNHYKGYLKDLKANVAPAGTEGTAMVSPKAVFDGALAALPIGDPRRNGINLLSKAAGDGAELDSKQSGWGISPILGANFSWNGLNIGTKYEFRTRLNVENKTSIDDTGESNNGMFADGVNTAHDIPALFTIGAEYQILPQLKAAIGYHHFFDKSAKISANRHNYISGTNEYLAGVEYQVNKMFLVSAGGQITKYGIKDERFQSDLSFSVNSHSIGGGGAANISKNVQINVGYFFTKYDNYNTGVDNPAAPTNTYTRTNKVFSAGVEVSF